VRASLWRALAALLCGCWLAALAAEPLRLYTEEYPPINFSEAGEPVGLATEVVREILRRSGQVASIEVVPWARGYQEAQARPNTGLFVTMRTAERESLFKWVGPITVNTTSFYGLRSSNLRIASLEDARQHGAIAVPRQWYSHQVLLAAGFTNLHPVPGPEQMVSMFKRGRVKLMVVDNLSLPALLERGGLPAEQVALLFTFLRSYTYIAFSPQTDDTLIARWQAELDGMKVDGSFAAIYQKWLPGQELPGLRAAE